MGQRTSNKFETSEKSHPILAFQNTGTEFMIKLDLKDAYFCAPLKTESRKYVQLHWEGTAPGPASGLGPAPLIFTQILKVPIFLLRRLQIRVIIYLDDILLMSQTLEELLMSRDTIIFLLTQL